MDNYHKLFTIIIKQSNSSSSSNNTRCIITGVTHLLTGWKLVYVSHWPSVVTRDHRTEGRQEIYPTSQMLDKSQTPVAQGTSTSLCIFISDTVMQSIHIQPGSVLLTDERFQHLTGMCDFHQPWLNSAVCTLVSWTSSWANSQLLTHSWQKPHNPGQGTHMYVFFQAHMLRDF